MGNVTEIIITRKSDGQRVSLPAYIFRTSRVVSVDEASNTVIIKDDTGTEVEYYFDSMEEVNGSLPTERSDRFDLNNHSVLASSKAVYLLWKDTINRLSNVSQQIQDVEQKRIDDVDNLTQIIQQQGQTIQNLQHSLSEHQSKIENGEQQSLDKQQQIDNINQSLADKQQDIDTINQTLLDMQQSIDDLTP